MCASHALVLPHVYFRGHVVSKKEACISVASHSLQYGSTCFTGLRGYVRDGVIRVLHLKEHHRRLLNSLKIMGWKCDLSWDRFISAIRQVIEKNRPLMDFYIRPCILSESEVLYLSYDQLTFDLAIYLVLLGSLFDKERGLKLLISNWKKIPDEAISTKAKAGGSYLNSSLAVSDAKAQGFDDALLLDRNGCLAELSGANVLCRFGKEILLPPLGNGILEGITMRSILEMLKETEFSVRFEPINRSMIYCCDEIIVTGTAAEIRHVDSVDGRPIDQTENNMLCSLLQKRFQTILQMKDPKSKDWVTEFKL